MQMVSPEFDQTNSVIVFIAASLYVCKSSLCVNRCQVSVRFHAEMRRKANTHNRIFAELRWCRSGDAAAMVTFNYKSRLLCL